MDIHPDIHSGSHSIIRKFGLGVRVLHPGYNMAIKKEAEVVPM